MATVPFFNNVEFDQAAFGGNLAGLGTITAGGLIYAALRKAAVTLGPGRTPSPAQMKDGIDELRRLTGSLNCDRLFIFTNQRQEFALYPSKKTYTIGQDPTGAVIADLDAPRPQAIEKANIIYNTGGPDQRYPLALLTVLQWPEIRIEDQPATIPQALYNDRAYPLSTLYLYGQPQAGCRLELFYWYLVPTYQTDSDLVFLPPGYEDALTLNLACRLAPHFQRAVDADVRQQAREALMRVESINAPQPLADTGGAFGCGPGGYNIYSG